MLLNRIIATLFLLFVALSCLILFPIAVVIRLLTAGDPKLVILHRFTAWWALLYIRFMPAWNLVIQGTEHILPGQHYIIVSNHQSMLDILAGFKLPLPFKWVAKAELFSIPILGWNMWLNQHIRIHRGKISGIKEMLRSCDKALEKGCSVFIFPEGTRSPDGKMRDFNSGAFALAAKKGVPLLPVLIEGTAEALPKHSLNFHGRQTITLTVLPPITPDQIGGRKASELATDTRNLLLNQANQSNHTQTHTVTR
jgi:1-acyl-sn-glycerol-3-phosphate acyltransferase